MIPQAPETDSERQASSLPEKCLHCGLELPLVPIVGDHPEQAFCCQGCASVAAAISAAGLGNYYQILRSSDERANPARTTDRSYAECDDASFAEQHVRQLGESESEVILYLEGVHCAACVWLIERLPQLEAGVREARLDFGRRLLTLRWQPSVVALSQLARALDRIGYPAHPVRSGSEVLIRRAEERRQWVHLGVAGALAGNVMLLAFALYGGWFHGMSAGFETMFLIASASLTTLALVWPGRTFFRSAWASIRARRLHMDVPIAIGLSAGFFGSIWNSWRGGEVYFDSVCSLVFLLLIGRILQDRQQRRAFDAVSMLSNLTPQFARRSEGGAWVEVPISALRQGDCVEVRAGESVPADGRIEVGESSFDLSLLTGESVPQYRQAGAEIPAGAVNRSDRVVLEVIQTGSQTRVGKLMQLVERHARERAPWVKIADRLAGRFVAVVLTLAMATAAFWSWYGPESALEHTIALLIVACPCALALATPLAVAASIGAAARHGILIKGGEALEALSRPGVLLLDKTGTLTQGRMRLQSWWGTDEARQAAWALESRSAHPLARAFCEATPSQPQSSATHVEESLGGGVQGDWNGAHWVIGSPKFITAQGGAAAWSVESQCHLDEILSAGQTPVAVMRDGQIVAWAGFIDPVREDAAASLSTLRAQGWQTRILSGDHQRVVESIGLQLGFESKDCLAEMSPEQKLEAVRTVRQQDTTVMIGDGVNDAAALAAAHVGVAVAGGAEASLAAADVYLAQGELHQLVQLTQGAQRTDQLIRSNLAFSLAYNAAGISLAMLGWIHPIAAAILMPLSSLTVVMTSYRGRTFEV